MKLSYTYWLLAAFLGGNILADSPVSCRQATLAEVYSVTALSQCGRELPNSFVRGMINRRRPCAEETPVARVYASRETCESCSSRSQVEQIRCDRSGCNVCEVRGYVSANVQDLASVSLRVRLRRRAAFGYVG